MNLGDFEKLVSAIRLGDREATADVIGRYEPLIRRVVRLRLASNDLRRLLDSMDISQSILGDFLDRAAAGRICPGSETELRSLLVTMALHKLIDRARHERRNLGGLPDGWDVAEDALAPDEVAAARELDELLRARLPSGDYSLLFERTILGRTWDQIACDRGGDPDALRMRLTRAIARVRLELRAWE